MAGEPSEPGRGERGRLREWTGRGLLLFLSVVLALLAGEGLVRQLAPQQLILLRPDVWIPDDGLGWRVAAHLDTRINTGEGETRLRTDADGHRVGDADPGAASWRVLALGDSYLAGIQVAYEEIATARLEASLSREMGAAVRVTNTGVGGYGPSHYLLKARRELARGSYDLVLVFLFRGNDVVEERIDHFPPKEAEVRHSFRWPRSREAKELKKALLYPVNDFLEVRSHLFVRVRHAARYQLMKLGLSARVFPEAELLSQAGSPRWAVTGELCEEIAATAESHGLRNLFVLVPGTYHVDEEIGEAYARGLGYGLDEVDLDQSSRLLRRLLAERGLEGVDTTEAVRERRLAGVATHGEVDTHLTSAGHEAVAAAISGRVLELMRRRAADGERNPPRGEGRRMAERSR